MSRKARPSLAGLEQTIGYAFADRGLLERALTHISAAANADRRASNQRLEFLGDRVLGVAVARMLYDAFPDDDEGAMSRRLSDLVRKEACAAVARSWDLGPYLRLGAGESQSGGRRSSAILADACEAVIGAVFLDGGMEAAASVVERGFGARMRGAAGPPRDAKTVLQEWAQARGLAAPTYRLVTRTGPDHHPDFIVAVSVAGHSEAEGRGRSKRGAEQDAALAFLGRERITGGGFHAES